MIHTWDIISLLQPPAPMLLNKFYINTMFSDEAGKPSQNFVYYCIDVMQGKMQGKQSRGHSTVLSWQKWMLSVTRRSLAAHNVITVLCNTQGICIAACCIGVGRRRCVPLLAAPSNKGR